MYKFCYLYTDEYSFFTLLYVFVLKASLFSPYKIDDMIRCRMTERHLVAHAHAHKQMRIRFVMWNCFGFKCFAIDTRATIHAQQNYIWKKGINDSERGSERVTNWCFQLNFLHTIWLECVLMWLKLSETIYEHNYSKYPELIFFVCVSYLLICSVWFVGSLIIPNLMHLKKY